MKKILLLLVVLVSYLPAGADVTPLPEIQFNFIYHTEKHPLINPQDSELLQCKDRLCKATKFRSRFCLRKNGVNPSIQEGCKGRGQSIYCVHQ